MYLTSLPLVSVRRHDRSTRWNFISSASNVFLVHNLGCAKCIELTDRGAGGWTTTEGEDGGERFFLPAPSPSAVVSLLAPVSRPPHDLPQGLRGWIKQRFETIPRNAKSLQFDVVPCFPNLLFNPFTPKSDQVQISPAASPEMYYITQYEELGFS